MSDRPIRNIAIIAHVDHGKTTLVDKLLRQSGTFAAHQHLDERVMDSNDLEKERGITILSKNTSVEYQGIHINIVDTPGHADFGGEVERVLGMVDGVLLLVDAVEGPMPQTRFVTKKALALGLRPIVVVNKVDRDGANPDNAVNLTFDLFDKLGASDEQLDFPIVYASALNGWAALELDAPRVDMTPLFETVLNHVPAPDTDVEAPLQFQISALDYSSYVGRIGIGRIKRGRVKTGQQVLIMFGTDEEAAEHERTPIKAKIGQVFGYRGLNKVELDEGHAGDIVQITGIEDLVLGCTVTDPENPETLPLLKIDEPTLEMQFMVNTSPLAGTEGKFVTSRQIRDRLHRELLTNMALRVHDNANGEIFDVSGRGELHLGILLENMRREGFELAVGRPRVVKRIINGVECEPYEMLTVDVEEQHQGGVMDSLGQRKGDLQDMMPDGRGRVRIEYRISARGLIGFQGEFMNLTRGTGLMSHVFDEYAPCREGSVGERRNGVLVSQDNGDAVAYALWKLQDRGRMFVVPGDKLYEGMIIGIHSRENDLVVNPIKGKQLTNIRTSSTDEAVRLVPAVQVTLESAIEFIADDELVELTPKSIRMRKRLLTEIERKRAQRGL
ncbi:MAG: translational GTPase TypA [Dechloromonas sp.]|uniref:Large ribosomal subunit assembly factor BipA n=1 Tax=Candidatus Dechloromonas phosphorivorans TaxID=2899244 RepID=A0A9D7LPV4_9RHOO|nr:translational GTPase TypA [Candidatus Dechloromonas phosphorivorans]